MKITRCSLLLRVMEAALDEEKLLRFVFFPTVPRSKPEAEMMSPLMRCESVPVDQQLVMAKRGNGMKEPASSNNSSQDPCSPSVEVNYPLTKNLSCPSETGSLGSFSVI